MPTFDEIAKDYSDRFERALERDGFFKSTATISESTLKRSSTLTTLKEIAVEIDRWEIDGEPLTDDQKKQIYRRVTANLQLSRPDTFPGSVKCASNDAYIELVNHISNLVKDKDS
jgi:hypothetical protein